MTVNIEAALGKYGSVGNGAAVPPRPVRNLLFNCDHLPCTADGQLLQKIKSNARVVKVSRQPPSNCTGLVNDAIQTDQSLSTTRLAMSQGQCTISTGIVCPDQCTCNKSSNIQDYANHFHSKQPVAVHCLLGGLKDKNFAKLVQRLPSGTTTLWVVGSEINPNNFSMSEEFIRLNQLQHLHLIRCGLYSLGKRVLVKMKNLNTLHLEENLISHIGPDTFDNTEQLQKLVLRNNNLPLDALPTGSFAYLKSLQILDLSYNKKRGPFAANIFSGLINLRQLALDGDLLMQQDWRAFDDLPNIEKLLLHNCEISSSPPEYALRKNIRLKYLDLSANALTSTDLGYLIGRLPAIEELNISKNRRLLAELTAGAFAHARLKSLNLAGNGLGQLTNASSYQQQHHSALMTLLNGSRLEQINLCNNGFQQFQSSMLVSSQKTISKLSLCGNQLRFVDDQMTKDMYKLNLLDLSDNRIETLPIHLPSQFSNLVLLNLSGNAISTLHPEHMHSLKKLKVLDISRCKLTQLPGYMLDLTNSFDQIYLHDNPWSCRCEVGPLKKFLQKNKHKHSLRQVQCITPKDMQGLSVISIDEQNSNCILGHAQQSTRLKSKSSLFVIIIGMTLIVLLVNVTIVILCIYNRPNGTYRTHEENDERCHILDLPVSQTAVVKSLSPKSKQLLSDNSVTL
ncbi:Carboxypeptidase N subunit 2 [Trichinella pseudospiralis]|uniref:Carboxypeptidase N subunit 2 n=1 Tax=Trichinella pseudospiralis TaxID=6337 RepID=A0A0V0XKG2_TRIPS|nr:Carboxypeptidase N subunit 2 [Trichinella pseudospiralis]KRX88481.1 Carboxypeptidase N subunit 2 [Trichinella pseudospiralis]